MAYLANTNQYYRQNEPTVKEVVDPDISIKDPVDTPLQMLFAEETVGQPVFTNIVDEVRRNMTISTIATLATPAGADATFGDAPRPRVKIGNVTQINKRQIDVTGTQMASDIYGVANEMAYQIENESLGLGCETEMALHWGLHANAPTNQSANPTVMHGLIPWIAELGGTAQATGAPAITSRGLNNGSGPAVPLAFFPNWYYSAGGAAITPTILFSSILAPAWRKGMRVNGCLGIMGSALKTAINSLTFGGISANTREVPADMRAIYTNVDLIDTQWGKLWLMTDRYMDLVGQSLSIPNLIGNAPRGALTVNADQTLLFMEPSYFKIAILRRRHMEALAKIGDSIKTQIIQELSLKVRNPLAATGGCNLIP